MGVLLGISCIVLAVNLIIVNERNKSLENIIKIQNSIIEKQIETITNLGEEPC